MSRSRKTALGFAVLGGILLAPLANLWPRPFVAVTGTLSGSGFEPISRRLQESCVDCHGRDLGRLPWYASLPGASSIIDRDRARAIRAWALERAGISGERGFTDADLAAIGGVLRDDSMPPLRYLAGHWNARLGDADRLAFRLWARSVRSSAPESENMAPARRGDPVNPLVPKRAFDAAKVALGERLFHDRRLSADGRISCSSCHDPKRGGTDQSKVSAGVRGQQTQNNAPTVFNATYDAALYWDGRARDLREQALRALSDPLEMGETSTTLAQKLGHDETYRAEFQRAYPTEGVRVETIADAIARFEESLVTPDAPFDRYLRGEEHALEPTEQAGYQLFLDLGCGDCHFGPALGGRSFQLMGKKRDYFGDRGGETDADLGRYRVTRDERDRHRFKVPTLRNVALTFPYFHDGSTSSLVDAVNTMARCELGRALTAEQTGKIVKFLESLTGNFRGKPLGRP
jgi:cytochrome c peroxidase